MANEFKIGDVVQLKSGRPEMTVSSIVPTLERGMQGKNDFYECTWFDGNNKRNDLFHPDTLKMVDNSDLDGL